MDALPNIRQVLRSMYRGEITTEQAAKLITTIDKASLAEFVVDAYKRGWINNRNLGMDEEGYTI